MNRRKVFSGEKTNLCACGCGESCHNKYVKNYHTKVKKDKKPCACGCGEEVAYNKTYIFGHQCRGRKHTEESKAKMSVSRSGEKNHFYGKTHTEETKQKIREVQTGHVKSQETLEKMRIASTGKKHTEETKKKMSLSKSGENNPLYGKTLSKEHKQKLSNALSGENNPIYGTVRSEETRNKISVANKKYYETHDAAFKGCSHTEEAKKKLSIAHTGKVLSEKHRKNISFANIGENNSFYGEKHTEEVKQLLSQLGIERWNDKEFRGKMIDSFNNKQILGPNNPNWKGGLSFEDYPIIFNTKLKTIIRERDEFTCQICGKEEDEVNHACHHIDYDKENCSVKNLVLLCASCHSKTNGNREYWNNYFAQKNKRTIRKSS